MFRILIFVKAICSEIIELSINQQDILIVHRCDFLIKFINDEGRFCCHASQLCFFEFSFAELG
jgi:hypothetical protein